MRAKKLWESGIIIFWCIMIALLIKRNLPQANKDQISIKKIALDSEELERDTWMGIYLEEKKIGYSHFSISKAIFEGQNAYCLMDETFMKFKYLDQTYDAHIQARAYVKMDMKPLYFSMNIFTEVYRASIEGRTKGDKIEVVVDSGGTTLKKTFPISSSTYLPLVVDLILPKQKLEIGRPYRLQLFDPQILSGEYITITLKRKEKIGSEEVLVVEKDYKGLITTSWINMKGEVLKEENPLGLKMLSESKEIALANGKFEAGELVRKASIPSNIFISNARNVSYLKVRMRGLKGFVIPSNSRQLVKEENGEVVIEVRKEWIGEPGLTKEALKEYLLPSMLIQSSEPEIVNKAIEITEDDTRPWEKAKHLNKWVFWNIQKVPTFSLPSAINVLKEKRGDCNEHTALLVALARACNIPARAVTGIAYVPPTGLTIGEEDRGSFFYHAWVEVYISGTWRMLDPTFGQEDVDATHIKFLHGDIEKQAEIVRLIGNLKISVEEYK